MIGEAVEKWRRAVLLQHPVFEVIQIIGPVSRIAFYPLNDGVVN